MKHLIASASSTGAALSASAVETPAGAELTVSHDGSRKVVAAPADYFTGAVTVEMLFTPEAHERMSAGKVTFSPGARTTWHTHPIGQTLIVTAGVGRVQREDGPILEIRVGDVVRIPANMRHWHGATPDSAMTHIALTESLEGRNVEWQEPVSDEQYGG